MDSILCLDTSGSMQGNSLRELKAAVLAFIDFAQQVDIGSHIGIVEFGNNTGIRTPLTTNYSALRASVNGLQAGGSTPMAEGLIYALKELTDNGRILQVGSVSIMPRLIIMTDGNPDDKDKVAAVAKAFGDIGFPIACVGVSGCDTQLMKGVAALTGGMFSYAYQIEELSLFFLKQIYLTIYIAKYAAALESLYSREVLREFFYQQTGKYLDDDELDVFILYLKALTKQRQQSTPPPQRQITYQTSTAPTYQSSYTPSYTAPSYSAQTTYVNTSSSSSDSSDVTAAALIFLFGWCGICCIWLGGFAYIKSSNPSARCLAWASLTMYCLTTIAVIIICSVAIANASDSNYNTYNSYNSYYNSYYDSYYYNNYYY